MYTVSAKPAEVQRKWFVIDAEDKILGRLSSEVAKLLLGKHKPIYTPHVDTGDHVIIINADKIKVTGRKRQQKMYYRHTEYPGGLKAENMEDKLEKNPSQVVELAIKRMLPRTKLGRQILSKLNVYAGSEHPHAAQQPELLEV